MYLHLKRIYHTAGEHSFFSNPCWHNYNLTSRVICNIFTKITVFTFAASLIVTLIIAARTSAGSLVDSRSGLSALLLGSDLPI